MHRLNTEEQLADTLDPDVLVTRSGTSLRLSDSRWVLSNDLAIDWTTVPLISIHFVAALKKYIRQQLINSADTSAFNAFDCMLRVMRTIEDMLSGSVDDDDLGYEVFSAAKNRLVAKYSASTIAGDLGAYKRWYIWCADAGLPGFDLDVASRLEATRIGRVGSGQAVLSRDPNTGPLSNVEFTALTSKLKATTSSELSLGDVVLTWLLVCFGLNPKAARLIDEQDFLKTALDDGSVIYELRIPRIKKRHERERTQFRTRKLDSRLGNLIEQLLAENEAARLDDPMRADCRFSRPLICHSRPRTPLLGTQFEVNAYRLSTGGVVAVLRRVTKAFDLKVAASGEPLHLTPRRLRYTYATRLVQSGASPLVVADALDHTDTSHVMVYFNARSDIVEQLDGAIALRMAPYAQAFMGTLIRTEAEAARAGDPASRISHPDMPSGGRRHLGSCGNFGYCGLFAPFACYTCVLFQPWSNADHQSVLDDLIGRRDDHLDRGAEPRMTQMHDLTILAVAEVVRRCHEINAAASVAVA